MQIRPAIPRFIARYCQGIPGLQDKALPDDLLDDFKQMAAAEEAEA